MKKILIAFFVLFLSVKVNALNSVEGSVTDTKKEPLIGATVYIPELNRGVVVDVDGNYKISKLPKGDVKIIFSYLGFATKVENLKNEGPDNKLNIVLKPTIVESNEVVVTGNYINSQHDNAVKIEVLDANKIDLAGTPNFMESLTSVPGVDMISKGQGVAKPVIRGLSMNNILVLNNGVRTENYQFSENHPIGIDENSVDRVEIIKGPASLLFGSDAIGGVLNFIKEKPAPEGKIVGDYTSKLYSNTMGIDNSLGIKGASENIFGGVRVGYKNHEDYKMGGGDYVPNSRFKEFTLTSNAGYTNKLGSFKLYYDFFKQKLGMSVPAAIKEIKQRGRNNEIWYQDLDHHVISSKNRLYIGDYKLDVNVAYQNAIRKLNTGVGITAVDMNLQTITYESKLHLPFNDKTNYIVGVQGLTQYNRNHNNSPAQFLPDANVNNIGVLGLVQYFPIQRLKVQAGVRYDYYHTKTFALGEQGENNYHAPVDVDYSNVNGSIGATYNAYKNSYFRLNLAKGYRVPNLSELTSNGAHGNRYEVGNSDLNPQDSYETDLSYHYHNKTFVVDLAMFYNMIDNYIFISPTGKKTSDDMDIYQYSESDSKLYGGECGIHYHPEIMPWLHLKTTYSMTIGKEKNGGYLPFIPAHKLRYEAMIKIRKLGFFINPNLKVSALSAFDQNKVAFYESNTDGYSIFNVSYNASLKINNYKFDMGVSANNIFDEKYIDHLSTLKDLGYYNQGQNVCLFLKFPLAFDL